MLTNRESAVGSYDDAVSVERSMKHPGFVLLECRDGRRQLTQQADAERRIPRPFHGFGQSQPRCKRGDHGEAVFVAQSFERPDHGECRMLERPELLDPLAQATLESGISGQGRPESENFPGRSAGVVEHQQTITEPVRVSLCVPRRQMLIPFDCR